MTHGKDSEIFPDIRVHPVQEPVTSQPESHLEETEQPETQGENETKYDWSTEGTGPIVGLCHIPDCVTRVDVHGQKFCDKPMHLSWHACFLSCVFPCTGIPGCYLHEGGRVGEFFKDKTSDCKDSYTSRR